MYSYIKGSLEEKMSNYIVVENGGIGYKIFMSKTAIGHVGEIRAKVKIFTHYHVREDEISLYGFLTNEELKMFELLLSVSGVGAKSAISMLSNISPSEFAVSIVNNDITKLTDIQINKDSNNNDKLWKRYNGNWIEVGLINKISNIDVRDKHIWIERNSNTWEDLGSLYEY